MKKINFVIACAILLCCSLEGMSQFSANDLISVNQKDSKYPGFKSNTYDGAFSGGHSFMWMGNFGGTPAAPTATSNGRLLGTIIYAGHDGQQQVQTGRIAVASTGNFSSNNHPVKMRFQLGGGATCCGAIRMTIDGNSGNVGIGTDSPGHKLDVVGTAQTDYLIVNRQNSTVEGGEVRLDGATGSLNSWHLDNYSGHFRLHHSGREYVRVLSNGNMGIGTGNPGAYKLAVNGTIRAKEVRVETGWADFVFEKEYALPSLEEVKMHILEKGHLKDIPSAEEVEKNGIELGEINAKLLQKIEELTLYTIKQEERINELEMTNKSLMSLTERMNALENQVKNNSH